MLQAVPAGEGAMAAIIGLDDDKVLLHAILALVLFSAVNFNFFRGQVVIAGHGCSSWRTSVNAKEAGGPNGHCLCPMLVCASFSKAWWYRSHSQPDQKSGLVDTLEILNVLGVPTCTLIQNVTAQVVLHPAIIKSKFGISVLSEPVAVDSIYCICFLNWALLAT